MPWYTFVEYVSIVGGLHSCDILKSGVQNPSPLLFEIPCHGDTTNLGYIVCHHGKGKVFNLTPEYAIANELNSTYCLTSNERASTAGWWTLLSFVYDKHGNAINIINKALLGSIPHSV